MSVRPPNLNTAVGIATLSGIIITAVFYVAPLRTLPDDQRRMALDLAEVQRTQAVQTEAIKALADLTRESQGIRRDVDRNANRLDSLEKRLDKLEGR